MTARTMLRMGFQSSLAFVVIGVASLLALSMAPVAAQTWPQRTVKFILTLGPGSGADIGARLIAEDFPRAGASLWWLRTVRAEMELLRSTASSTPATIM